MESKKAKQLISDLRVAIQEKEASAVALAKAQIEYDRRSSAVANAIQLIENDWRKDDF